MKIKHVTQEELDTALTVVNTKFDGNVRWNRCDKSGKQFCITLRVNDSKGEGSRVGHTGRRMVSACWHTHGEFFDALLAVQPKAIIVALGRRIECIDGIIEGNWKDWNAGSLARPNYISALCECSWPCEVDLAGGNNDEND